MAPKVFDLLVLLLENRHRVVTKAELLDRLWPGTRPTENVIARAVMKVRQAIGDIGDAPRFIKTIQRVGYRFVQEIRTADSALGSGEDVACADARSFVTSSPNDAQRLVLLPFELADPDPGLAWVELGLLSVVRRCLLRDSRLSVTPIGTLLRTLGEIDRRGPQSVEQDAARYHQLVRADWLVKTVISRSDVSGYALSYVLVACDCPDVSRITGVLVGKELVELGEAFAAAICRMLPGQRAAHAHCKSEALLRLLGCARARHASIEYDGESALAFLRVVLDVEPLKGCGPQEDTDSMARGESAAAGTIEAARYRERDSVRPFGELQIAEVLSELSIAVAAQAPSKP